MTCTRTCRWLAPLPNGAAQLEVNTPAARHRVYEVLDAAGGFEALRMDHERGELERHRIDRTLPGAWLCSCRGYRDSACPVARAVRAARKALPF